MSSFLLNHREDHFSVYAETARCADAAFHDMMNRVSAKHIVSRFLTLSLQSLNGPAIEANRVIFVLAGTLSKILSKEFLEVLY